MVRLERRSPAPGRPRLLRRLHHALGKFPHSSPFGQYHSTGATKIPIARSLTMTVSPSPSDDELRRSADDSAAPGIRWRDRLTSSPRNRRTCRLRPCHALPGQAMARSRPRLEGDSFIKLYTHGAQERNSSALLGGGLKAAFDLLAAEAARRGSQFILFRPGRCTWPSMPSGSASIPSPPFTLREIAELSF